MVIKAFEIEDEIEFVEAYARQLMSKYADKWTWKNDNTLSVKEYSISGLCQKCQDEVFGSDSL